MEGQSNDAHKVNDLEYRRHLIQCLDVHGAGAIYSFLNVARTANDFIKFLEQFAQNI